MREGQRGYCFVRQRQGEQLVLTHYGRLLGLVVDPIEKKPLYHLYPGTTALSLGTVGCNLGCRFCQNWSASRAREGEPGGGVLASPEQVARAAIAAGCRSVAFTYNDPIVFAEYAIDAARAAREQGLATVAVTAGYVTPAARRDFFAAMDATNIDLKAITPDFYRRLCGARLEPVLDTLRYVARETSCWLEVTTLLIPGHNDSDDQLTRLSAWCARELGPEVPLHFSAFHPAHRLRELSRTPVATCQAAREIARREGLRHVYLGNVRDPEAQSTRCPACGGSLIERDGHRLRRHRLRDGACPDCGRPLVGRFDPAGEGREPAALEGTGG